MYVGSEDAPVCRFCLESEVGKDEELLAPCRCSGSMRFVHRHCLDRWRIESFDPKTMTHCGTCKAQFRLQESCGTSKMGAAGEVWLQICRYLAIRLGSFLLVVVALGFVPYFFCIERMEIFSNPILNHLSFGTVTACALTGAWGVLQAIMAIDIFNFSRGSSWGSGGDSDWGKIILVILVIIGVFILLYYLVKGLMEIATTGGQLASANMRVSNKHMRTQIAKRYRVLNFDEGNNHVTS
eukprot:gnl/MRDRNA2_/MRDRNA2_152914_c0_seq1.p1 gnl/MRDRNA2_/MRDRNA2_152914_c0~~gnl/MRDRNA2_/MRDRNA2_152914_c0_seq1.p1  ORF type:complete len:239 (-),score=23.73 gnl/MRDRNA2_/MRDRNA2_152914_c0_seq1:489-1205(-)